MPLIRTKHSGYKPDGQRLHPKGGKDNYYDQLNELYGLQVEQGRQQMGLANEFVVPTLRGLASQANDFGSLANRERAAATFAADSSAAAQAGRQALMDDMASFGVNPGDARFGAALAKASTAGAAADAAGRTAARDTVDQLGFARMKDFASLGMGMQSNATEALSSAGNTANSVAQMRMGQANANSQAWGDMARGAMNVYGMYKGGNLPGFADGGHVQSYAQGGYVQRMARGGLMRPVQAPLQPPMVGQQPSTANQVAGPAGAGMMRHGKDLGNAIAGMSGPPSQVALPSGVASNMGITGAQAQQVAASQVETALATGNTGSLYSLGASAPGAQGLKVGADAAGMLGMEAAGGAAAAEGLAGGAGLAVAEGAGAAGAAGAGALGTVGAAIGTAMPWIGAALLLGSAMDMFADGGEVRSGDDASAGGEVDGPGGPKDDLIPALLSDGEFVLPVGAVKKFGLDKLEKMRQAGLEYEKQLGIGAMQ